LSGGQLSPGVAGAESPGNFHHSEGLRPSNLLDPAARAQQPDHTDFSPSLWDWDADGVRGTAARMEQLCVHALLVQLYAPHLVAEGEVPPPPSSKGFGGRAGRGGADGVGRAGGWVSPPPREEPWGF